jgi:hypothetical protein
MLVRHIFQILVLSLTVQNASAQVTEFFYQAPKDTALLRAGGDVQMSKVRAGGTDIVDQTTYRAYADYSYGLSDRLSLGVLIPYTFIDDNVAHRQQKSLSDFVFQLKANAVLGALVLRYGANLNWSPEIADTHVAFSGNQSLAPYFGMDYHPNESNTFGGNLSYEVSLIDRKYNADDGIVQKSQVGAVATASLFYEHLLNSSRLGVAVSHTVYGNVREFDGAQTERLSQTAVRAYWPIYLKPDLSSTIIPTAQYSTSFQKDLNGSSVDSTNNFYVGLAYRMNLPSASSSSDED